ncbi:MAG: regulator of sigma E protease [Parcubacteria group bacterium Gr01-1014_106]|nr:MAG: regulator of sigma E protease [Parcubacteria group bacterium Gr01-1014_106]
MLITIIAFAAVLLALILIHEAGHALLARLLGVRVEEFGFGFPPRLAARRIGETIYSVNTLPIGGFVRLTGEDDSENTDPRSFATQTRFRRALIVAGGVLANLLLAVVVFTLVAGFGVDVPALQADRAVQNRRVEIVDVQDTPVLRTADLRPQDALVAVNDVPVETAAEAATRVREFSGDQLTVTVIRAGQEKTIALTFSPPKTSGQRVGLALLDIGTVRVPWSQAPLEGIRTTGRTIWLTVHGIVQTFRDAIVSRHAPEGLAGPVGIASITGTVARRGVIPLLELVGVLSVNLALINVLPIPALDGGRLLFLALDAIGLRWFRGRPERLAHTIGFVALLILLALITVGDVQRLIHQ